MQYREDRYHHQLSVLGYGCMRFTQKLTGPDVDKAEKEILEAIKGGVNYFDTAYIYPGSEACLGEILERNHLRDKVYIATKLPHYMLKSQDDAEKFFQEELRRLRTDHVDYYLMHMLTDAGTWKRLVDLGIDMWLAKKKEAGQIGQVGFSYHGNTDAFLELLGSYDWDFCQIQYNYMDAHSQAGVEGLHAAAAKGIPVVIMEPLRGGRLVRNLPEEAKRLMAAHPSGRTPAQWSFSWLWDQPEVTVVLSGMNSVEMVKENVQAADKAQAGILTEEEKALLDRVAQCIGAKNKVGCTGCRYCMPCPQGVDIPGTFSAYNRYFADAKFWGLMDYVMCTTLRGKDAGVSHCIGCGKCERHCPQGIPIREQLQNAKGVLEGPLYQIGKRAVKLFMRY